MAQVQAEQWLLASAADSRVDLPVLEPRAHKSSPLLHFTGSLCGQELRAGTYPTICPIHIAAAGTQAPTARSHAMYLYRAQCSVLHSVGQKQVAGIAAAPIMQQQAGTALWPTGGTKWHGGVEGDLKMSLFALPAVLDQQSNPADHGCGLTNTLHCT
jgi:hypothetical protein